jgi:hypothetical protein
MYVVICAIFILVFFICFEGVVFSSFFFFTHLAISVSIF